MSTEGQIFTFENDHNPPLIVALKGAEELGKKIDNYLVNWYNRDMGTDYKSFMVSNACPRFNSGDAKGLINESVRGKELYIIVDVGNYSCTYKMFGELNRMSPDDHYADLKRIIAAIGGKAKSVTVIMPCLYGGRQHKRSMRESLDAATMLQELEAMGVRGIITFDAHDPRVQNAVPLMGFDNFMPNYQILKALLKKHPDLKFDKDHFMIVSPDEGAMQRNIYYSSLLKVDLGMFYKRRDYSTVVNGRNPIVAHEYIGNPVMGMDIFVADDIIATGDSVLRLAEDLKQAGAGRIFLSTTYALFTEGIDAFKKAYQEGLIENVIGTNLTYLRPELADEPWFIEADMSKYIAYIISAFNQNKSVTSLLEPHDKIRKLFEKYNVNLG